MGNKGDRKECGHNVEMGIRHEREKGKTEKNLEIGGCNQGGTFSSILPDNFL